MSKWTKEEIKGLKDGWELGTPIRTLAESLGKSPKAVERKVAGLGLKARESGPKAPKNVDKSDYWKQEYKRVRDLLEHERYSKTEVESLIEEVRSFAPQSYETAPPVFWPAQSNGSAQSAVLMLSDQHVGQVVDEDQTLGFGKYDVDMYLGRLKRLEEATYSILHDHTTTRIDELVVPMLGDMMHGALNHATEAGQRHTLFEQFFIASHSTAQFLRNLSALVPKVRIYTAVGNHTRWQNQRKMPTDNRYSNLDQFAYATIQALTRDIPTIEWNLNKQPMALFQVQGFQFCAAHGDVLRGGDKALGVPAHSIARQISSMMGLRARANEKLVNYFLFGHVHKPIQLPHTLGEVITNGGFPGVDGYGLAEGFQSYWPSQKFFLVHPKFGRTACYDLDLTQPTKGKTTYNIPTV